MSTNKRIRGRKLQAIRKRSFMVDPLCQGGQYKDGTTFPCQSDRLTFWTARDHIIPVGQGGEDSEDNTQYLCAACHDAKTANDLGRELKPTFGLDGWPKDT